MAPDRTVSVVIPAFNAARYLGEALESVRSQTAPVAEVIVVDDGSTDDTRAWEARMPGVRWLVKSHEGISAARNAGASMATSTYLAFLDADDRWLPGKLAVQLAAFNDDPAIDLVFGHARQFRSPELPARPDIRVDTAPVPGLVPGTLLLRRETFWRVGPFDATWRVGELIDWYAKAQSLGLKSVTCPDVVLERRVHDDNTGIRERAAQTDYLRILKAALDRRRAGKERE
jgi:glycosyltransferase involved in cell wall biosynthesis